VGLRVERQPINWGCNLELVCGEIRKIVNSHLNLQKRIILDNQHDEF
jgi:hypothetical protein